MFEADGAGSCPGTESREVCGRPTTFTNGAQTVAVTARDASANRAEGDRNPLTFQVSAPARPALAATPSPLTEANFDGAALTMTLPSGGAFARGVSASSFAPAKRRQSPAFPV